MKQGHGGFAREGGEISCLVAAMRQFLGAQFQRFKQKYFGQNRKKAKLNNFLDELLGKDFGCGMRQKRILRYIARIKLRHKDLVALGCRGGFQ